MSFYSFFFYASNKQTKILNLQEKKEVVKKNDMCIYIYIETCIDSHVHNKE